MHIYFKKFIICICLICSFSMFARPQRANAIIPFLVIGGIEVSVEVLVGILITSGGLVGIEAYANHKEDLEAYVRANLLSLSLEALNSYFKTSVDESGQEYISVSQEGKQYSDEYWADLKAKANFPVSTAQVTNNVAIDPLAPFMKNGFYMQSYPYVYNGNYLNPFLVKAGDSFSMQLINSDYKSTVISCSFNPTKDAYVSVYSYTSSGSSNYIKARYTYDNVNYTNLPFYENGTAITYNFPNVKSGGHMFIGYNTNTNTVYVPTSDVVRDTGIETGLEVGDTVAYPISGQYSSEAGTKVYEGVEGATAGVVSGLTVKNLSTTTDNATDTTASSFWEALWDWLQEILDTILSIPSTLIEWFTVDWARVKLHINYLDIVKAHLQPIFDLYNLISNVSADIKNSDGKFYMKIPHEMGGDDNEHCVLDLTIASAYISFAREIIKYGMWITLLWYILRKFDPKFSI